MAGLLEIIKRVGEENVKVQPLSNCMTKIDTKKRGGIKGSVITFETFELTAEELASGTNRYTGTVIWMPKEKLAAVIAKLNAEGS